jgi:predicted PurR-regulated permease PerM
LSVSTWATVRSVTAAIVTLAVASALWLARDIVLLVYISVLLAVGLGPLVLRIEGLLSHGRYRLPRAFAIAIIYLALVGLFTALGLLVVPPLVQQAQDLWTRMPELIDRGQQLLIRYGLLQHPLTLEEAVRNAPGPGDALGRVTTALTVVVGGLVAFLTILVLTFYLLVESDALFMGFTRLFPRADRPRVDAVARQISGKVSAWLNGQLILAGTIGLTAAIGLYLIGVPYFYVLALLAAIGEMIPVVGPILSAIPAILVALSVSPRTAVIVILFTVAQQQFENHILVPRVMERQVGVSAVTVIVALLLGASLLGILGAMLAVPTAAIIQVVLQELLDERDRLADEQLSPRSSELTL